MNMTLRRVLIVCILLLALFLRIYKVASIPPALSWDEVAIGYNAYSIAKTGFDEHHKFLPLDTFISYGDYKPPLSIYATVPAVLLFGLNEFSVRLPSVVAGVMTVWLTYLVVLALFKHFSGRFALGTISAAILALSPWHIGLSRAGFEANIATMLLVLGVWLVGKSQENRRLLVICWLPFIGAMYTFNSARYVAPLLGLGLLFFQRKNFLSEKKLSVMGMIVACAVLLPLVPHLLSPQARLRFAEVNIFTDSSIVKIANDRIAYDHNAWWSKLLDNRRIGYGREYLIHFFDNFQPWFLFIRGDGNPKFSIQEVGQLYLVEALFLLVGIYWVFRYQPRVGWFLLFWLVVAIVPAATARETPHALRIENSLPVWQIVIAAGIYGLWESTKRNYRSIFIGVVIVLYAVSLSYYLHMYYAHYAKEFSGEWQYGYKQAISYAQTVKSDYDQIVMSEVIGRPYMYVLFYQQYDPQAYWQSVDGGFDTAGFYNVAGFGPYRFVRKAVVDGKAGKKVLYIMPADEVPAGVHVRKTINLLNGKPILVIFDTQ